MLRLHKKFKTPHAHLKVMPNSDKKPSLVYWLGNTVYLNVTSRCSNSCCFCVRNFTDELYGFNLRLQKEATANQIIEELQKVLSRKSWDEIVFCGFGEPLERLDLVLEVTKWIKKNHPTPVRVNTNGQGFLLNKGRDVVTELELAGVDKVSVSLNAADKQTYNKICRPALDGAYESVLDFIKKANKVLKTQATAVSIPEVDMVQVKKLAKTLGVKFRAR